jgi:hypothetical protein
LKRKHIALSSKCAPRVAMPLAALEESWYFHYYWNEGEWSCRVIETTFCQYPRACVQSSGYNHQVTLRSKWKMLTWNQICLPILSLKWSITKQHTNDTILVTRFNCRS